MIHVLLPYMILSLYGGMRGINPASSARPPGLGASEWQTFRRVWCPCPGPAWRRGQPPPLRRGARVLHHARPPRGREGTTLAMLIEAHVSQTQDWPLASALGLVLLVATVVALRARAAGAPAGRRSVGAGRR